MVFIYLLFLIILFWPVCLPPPPQAAPPLVWLARPPMPPLCLGLCSSCRHYSTPTSHHCPGCALHQLHLWAGPLLSFLPHFPSSPLGSALPWPLATCSPMAAAELSVHEARGWPGLAGGAARGCRLGHAFISGTYSISLASFPLLAK